MSNLSDVYEIKIEFEKGSKNPSRVFKAMSGMIDGLAILDKELVYSIGTSVDPNLILEDIEVGSLRARIRTIVNSIDDDALKELDWKKAVGSFLVKGKQSILKHLEDKEGINSNEQINEIQSNLKKLAKETEVDKIPFYTPIPSKILLESLSKMYLATSNLSTNDSAFFISSQGSVQIPQGMYIPAQTIENLLTKEKRSYEREMILRIKKPDYLGASMWDFHYNNRTIQVKITDSHWLNDFQTGKLDVRPGDSLKAKVLMVFKYGFDNNIIAEHYYLDRVIQVIKNDSIVSESFPSFSEQEEED